MGRAGAFAANFQPEILNAFRALCKEQGKQYTKVLEQMAEIYVRSGGNIEALTVASSISTDGVRSGSKVATAGYDLVKTVARLEENEEYSAEKFIEIDKRLDDLERKAKK